MFKGRPVYDPETTVDLTGTDGKPLDLRRAFSTAESRLKSFAAFFRKTGFLLVKGLFSDREIRTLRSEVERAARGQFPAIAIRGGRRTAPATTC